MGREIRKVPKNWKHPKDSKGNFLPLHNQNSDDAFAEWLLMIDNARKGIFEYDFDKEKSLHQFCSENPCPSPEMLLPYKDDECDCFQIYETVSEGTPVSPVFETKEQLIEWMAMPIDMESEYTYISPYDGEVTSMQGKTREIAEAFAKSEWAPSMTMHNGVIKTNVETLVN